MDSSSRPYLSLFELGTFLESMSKTHGGTACYMRSFCTFYFCIHTDLVSLKRPLPDGLKVGESNLLVVPSGSISLFCVMQFNYLSKNQLYDKSVVDLAYQLCT